MPRASRTSLTGIVMSLGESTTVSTTWSNCTLLRCDDAYVEVKGNQYRLYDIRMMHQPFKRCH